jgi:hypothetical protein
MFESKPERVGEVERHRQRWVEVADNDLRELVMVEFKN